LIRLGLTGSIGMGKSVTAAMFRDEGVPVHDSDAAVHALYAPGGAGVDPVGAAFPGVVRDGAIDRPALSAIVLADPAALNRLNAIVHPLVAADRAAFVAAAADAPLVVFDIPLLFETGGEADVDKILVVTAPADVQRRRVLGRPGMTPERFAAILARQTPDAEKQARADYVLDTGHGLAAARAEVRKIVAALRSEA
jgi:dephospho-CoA kinase